jgi:hypothetical protein
MFSDLTPFPIRSQNYQRAQNYRNATRSPHLIPSYCYAVLQLELVLTAMLQLF